MAGVPTVFVLAWSSAYVVGDLGVRSTPPFTLLLARFGLAAVCMLVIAFVTKAAWPRGGRALAHIAVAGVLVQGVQFLAVYTGFKLGVPAAISSLVIGMNPLLTVLLARPTLGERPAPKQLWGFLLGATGVVLAVAKGLDFSEQYLAGIALTVLGLLALSGGTVYQKRFCPEMDLRTGTAVQLVASTVLAAVCAFTFEDVHTDNFGVFAFSVGWLALVNSILAFTLLFVMIRRGEVGRSSTMFFLVPSVTAMIASVTLREPLSWYAVGGFVLAAAGVLLAAQRRKGRSTQGV
ncbi:DMT family transporter [Amycolatopsis bartoniae]|nr:DMT family transporter [Amycolatopsis bartoniae]